MAIQIPKGQYRTLAVGDREAEAYVFDGAVGGFVPETDYRDQGYQPDFNDLPLQDNDYA